jgi:hypothetical protein
MEYSLSATTKRSGIRVSDMRIGFQRILSKKFLRSSIKGGNPDHILAVVGSWDYLAGIPTLLRIAVEEAPVSFHLARGSASPQMNLWHFLEALWAPSRLKRFFGTSERVPVIGMRHHDNHAYFPYAVSPFAKKLKSNPYYRDRWIWRRRGIVHLCCQARED